MVELVQEVHGVMIIVRLQAMIVGVLVIQVARIAVVHLHLIKEDTMSTLEPSMAIDPKKKRVEIHLMPEIKEALVNLAKEDKRSLLNYIETLLEKHVASKKKK